MRAGVSITQSCCKEHADRNCTQEPHSAWFKRFSALTRVVKRCEESGVSAHVAQGPDHVHLRLFAVVRRVGAAWIEHGRRVPNKDYEHEPQRHEKSDHGHFFDLRS